MPFGWMCSIKPLVSDGNIIFDLCLFKLCPLFQEHNSGIQQELMYSIWTTWTNQCNSTTNVSKRFP